MLAERLNVPMPELPTPESFDHVDAEASVEIQRSDALSGELPDNDSLIRWANAAKPAGSDAGVTIRIVCSKEMQQSNLQWRGKDKPTNVLSFPADFPAEAQISYLGDILICAEVVEQESKAQRKSLVDHWAHMVIHGVLHLRGYDHETEDEAKLMEQHEREILATLGIADPYGEQGLNQNDSST